MNQDIKSKIWHIVLTALGVGLVAVLTSLADAVKTLVS
jgi:hypothetical protein